VRQSCSNIGSKLFSIITTKYSMPPRCEQLGMKFQNSYSDNLNTKITEDSKIYRETMGMKYTNMYNKIHDLFACQNSLLHHYYMQNATEMM